MWSAILRALLGSIGPLLQLILTTLTDRKTFDVVLEKAKAAVASAEGLGPAMDGAVKRKVAFDAIVAELKAVGIAVAPFLINMAVEIAYAALKAQAAKPLSHA